MVFGKLSDAAGEGFGHRRHQPGNRQILCNGAPGSDGAAGADGDPGADGASRESAATPIVSDAGSCPSGGSRIDVGIDQNANGILDDGEVSGSTYLCNGAPGDDGAAGGCAAGGPSLLAAAGAVWLLGRRRKRRA